MSGSVAPVPSNQSVAASTTPTSADIIKGKNGIPGMPGTSTTTQMPGALGVAGGKVGVVPEAVVAPAVSAAAAAQSGAQAAATVGDKDAIARLNLTKMTGPTKI